MELYYGILNGGDGSANIAFYESLALANVLQETDDEGWAENCSGVIKLTSDSPITCDVRVRTVQGMIDEIDKEYNVDEDYYPSELYDRLKELLANTKNRS